MYSELEFVKHYISSILLPSTEIVSYEDMELLVGVAILIFLSCGNQLPVDIALRLSSCGVPLDEFFTEALEASSEFTTITTH